MHKNLCGSAQIGEDWFLGEKYPGAAYWVGAIKDAAPREAICSYKIVYARTIGPKCDRSVVFCPKNEAW